jgi:hypothetical protein
MLWLVSLLRPHLVVVTTSEELMTDRMQERRTMRARHFEAPRVPQLRLATYIRSPLGFFLK